MSRLPRNLRRYRIPQRVLDDSQVLLRESGRNGYESVVVWIGRVLDDETAEVTGVVRPEQVAYSGSLGCSVEVPPDALSELISSLPEEVFVLVRLHTHPTDAYHSDLDDTNMLIAHPGAISIVIPYFAQEPIALNRCSVNELRDGQWEELSTTEVANRFKVL